MDLLEEGFDVEVLWDDAWEGGAGVSEAELNALSPDIVVLFQMLRSPESLRRLRCKEIVLVPMFDAAEGVAPREWFAYRNCRFLNFSSTLAAHHDRLGLETLLVRFHRPAEPERRSFEILRGFFWQRHSEVTWEHVRSLVAGARFESFHLHLAVDPPGYPVVQPTPEDVRRYNITVSHWSESGEEYRRRLAEANVFFAPRIAEGIGQSFLEALSAGMLVVAPDRPTMNEYIVDGVNGLLFDPSRPAPLDFSTAENLGRHAWEASKVGHARWEEDRREVLRFIVGGTRRERRNVLDRVGIAMRRTACRMPEPVWTGWRILLNGLRPPYSAIPSRIPRAVAREAARLWRRPR